MAWNAEHLNFNDRERDFMKVTRFLIPKVPGIDNNIGKVFNLYRFLASHIDVPAERLASMITENERPLFEVSELKDIMKVLKKQQNTPYFKQLGVRAQRGGAPPSAVMGSPLDADATRSKFWDKWIRKITHTIGSYLPHTPLSDLCKNWDFYIYFLYSLEQMEMIGPFVSAALDSVTLSLPVLSDLASETVESIFVLLPVPYAAIIGQVLGYVVGTLFLLFALMLNMNRKHFGSAFKVSLELIPMFGDILAEAAVNFELAMERAMASRGRILGSIQTISPTAYSIADYYVPSVEIKASAPPAELFSRTTVNKIGHNIQNYAVSRMGIPKEKMEKISSVASNIMNIGPVVLDTATSLLSGSTAGITAAVSAAANKAVSQTVGAATAAVSAAANKAVSQTVGAATAAANKAVSQTVGAATVSGAANKAVSQTVGAATAAANKAVSQSMKPSKGGSRIHRRTVKHRRRRA